MDFGCKIGSGRWRSGRGNVGSVKTLVPKGIRDCEWWCLCAESDEQVENFKK